MQKQNDHHQPVLLDAVMRYLDPKAGESYLDLTAGYGGHAKAVLACTLKKNLANFNDEEVSGSKAVLVDRDQSAVNVLEQIFSSKNINILRGSFYQESKKLHENGESFDLILADLGTSSVHMNDGSRGFSFMRDGPLDMRMDQSQDLTAEKVINTYSESDLAEIIRKYGEDPRAKKIAYLVVRSRPVKSTKQLVDLIRSISRGRSKVHPATRTFQALRIEVNDEIGQLERSMPIWLRLLKPGGRLGVITFHSGEDRIVKNAFKEVSGFGYDAEFRLLTKKPITPDKDENVSNPRSRSAKLRAVAKIKN